MGASNDLFRTKIELYSSKEPLTTNKNGPQSEAEDFDNFVLDIAIVRAHVFHLQSWCLRDTKGAAPGKTDPALSAPALGSAHSAVACPILQIATFHDFQKMNGKMWVLMMF